MPLRLSAAGGLLSALVVCLSGLLPGGIEVDIDRRAIDEAASIARDRRESAVRAFNDRYTLTARGPKVERVEVITEFRRAVLLARKLVEIGKHSWTPYEIDQALLPWRRRLVMAVHVRFPPHHAMVMLPVYTAALSTEVPTGGAGATGLLRPLAVRADPVFPPGTPRRGESPVMQGASVEIDFDARALDPNGRYYFTVYEGEGRLDSVPLNLAEFR